jgi:hypothetical protein
MKISLNVKEAGTEKFYYIPFGCGYHGKTDFYLWINRRLVKFDENGNSYTEFPAQDSKVIKTEKGNYVLRQEEGWTTFISVGEKCGYRGSSSFEILEPTGEAVVLLEYTIYDSPAGSLGISNYGVVSVNGKELTIRWERTGRLYGESPCGIRKYYADGKEENFENLPDGLEALDELKKELL